MIYNGYEHPFDKIFESNKHKSIHQNNIESLAVEIYEYQAGLTPPIVTCLLPGKTNIILEISKNLNISL